MPRQSNSPQVFLSYKHGEHEAVVDAIADAVEQLGWEPWLDKMPTFGRLGIEPWMRKAIYSSSAMVYLEPVDARSAIVQHLESLGNARIASPRRVAVRLRRRLPFRLGYRERIGALIYFLSSTTVFALNAVRRVFKVIEKVSLTAEEILHHYRLDIWVRERWFAFVAGIEAKRVRRQGWQSWERQLAVSLAIPVIVIDRMLLSTFSAAPEDTVNRVRIGLERLSSHPNTSTTPRLVRWRYRLAQLSLPVPFSLTLLFLAGLLIATVVALALIGLLITVAFVAGIVFSAVLSLADSLGWPIRGRRT